MDDGGGVVGSSAVWRVYSGDVCVAKIRYSESPLKHVSAMHYIFWSLNTPKLNRGRLTAAQELMGGFLPQSKSVGIVTKLTRRFRSIYLEVKQFSIPLPVSIE